MPKDKAKGKARGRKRKASLPSESEETPHFESQPSFAVNVLASTNGGKYVPRFGSAAKKQRMGSEAKKLHRDTSEEEEQILCPISCTQPVGSARGSENEGEWSSTQPASRLMTGGDVEEKQVTNSLTELQHEIPSNKETEDNVENVTTIPGLALSQSLPPSPHPSRPCNNENEEVAGPNKPTEDDINSLGQAVPSDTEDTLSRSTHSENVVDDKCLNFLNPFSLDLNEEISCSKGSEGGHHDGSSLTTNILLADGAIDPTVSPTTSIVISTHAINSHRNIGDNKIQGCMENTGMLPSSRLDQAIEYEPIEESFYNTSSQEKEKKTTCTEDNGSNLSQMKDIKPLLGSGGSPFNKSADEVEALKELVDLEPDDLEESQLVVTSLTGDQTAPSPHVQLTPHATPFVVGHAQRRPTSEQSSQEMSLKEGTQIMHGLIEELSALKFILHCKRELETAFRQQRSSRHMLCNQHQYPSNLAKSYPTHTRR